MKQAYVDTSCLVALALDEVRAEEAAYLLAGQVRVVSSLLLEAEFLATMRRERRRPEAVRHWIAGVRWIHATSPLTAELTRVLGQGYLRGADLWHVATALRVFPEPDKVSFLTLDARQAEVAAALGFRDR